MPSLTRTLPLWAQRLSRTVESLRSAPTPSSPEEGLRQAVLLADLGWRQILSRLRAEHPDWSDREIEDCAYRELENWKRFRDRLTFRPRS
jgi:hypothetical protein